MQFESEPHDAKAIGIDGASVSAPQDAHLAAFQAALLELLAQPLSPAEMMERLQHDATFAPFADYVSTFEPRMLEVAAALVKKWGRRTETGSEAQPYSASHELGQMPH